MRRILLFLLLISPAGAVWAQFTGGVNDGFTATSFCGGDLNGSAASALAITAPSGGATVCANGYDNYSVTLTSGSAFNYTWSLPAGATVISQYNTSTSSTVSVLFGASGGSVSVTASNTCASITSSPLAVSTTSCLLTRGGNNDGFISASYCALDLNGTVSPTITLTAISGSATFCQNASDLYGVSLSASNASTFDWTVPSGATVVQSANTLTSSSINLQYATSGGTISVTASNGCTSATQNLVVAGSVCLLTFGGNDDGFGNASFCLNDLNGTVAAAVTLNAIVGAATVCSNFSETYSATLATGFASYFNWTGPTGYSIIQAITTGIGSSINMQEGTSSGTITVTASNTCTSDTKTLPVTVNICSLNLGGNNDGFSFDSFCANNLTGGAVAPLALNAITGPSTVCFNLGDTYSVTTSTGSATVYSWSGPTGATPSGVLSTLSTSTASITFGGTSGLVSVTASNACYSDTKTLAVTGTTCQTTFGGRDDGFGMGTATNILLPITLISFNLSIVPEGVGVYWKTETEVNNNFFTVERSKDGLSYENIGTVAGAGTSTSPHSYSFTDKRPYNGVSYYRLKQTDYDGTFDYSPIRAIEFIAQNDNSVLIYPNPTRTNSFSIKFSADMEGSQGVIQISNITGVILYQKEIVCVSPYVVRTDEQIFTPGLYILTIFAGSAREVKKVILQ